MWISEYNLGYIQVIRPLALKGPKSQILPLNSPKRPSRHFPRDLTVFTTKEIQLRQMNLTGFSKVPQISPIYNMQPQNKCHSILTLTVQP